jgi:RNA polymerase sigma factor (sigma-70 family)
MNLLNDETFVIKAKAGDETAYAFLVNRYKSQAFNLAYRILRNREDAEEVAQDAFIKVYEKLHQFRSESKFSTWLYRIVYNTSISRTRLKKPDYIEIQNEDGEEVNFEAVSYDFDRLAAAERKIYIAKSLESLPEDESFIISLYYMEDCSTEEIADITGLSISNVKVKLFRARKKLHTELTLLLKNEVKTLL